MFHFRRPEEIPYTLAERLSPFLCFHQTTSTETNSKNPKCRIRRKLVWNFTYFGFWSFDIVSNLGSFGVAQDRLSCFEFLFSALNHLCWQVTYVLIRELRLMLPRYSNVLSVVYSSKWLNG